MTHGPTRIESKEECIYCGAKDVDLTDEHVLPYFIGGSHIISDASCKPCAKVTSRFERDIAKGLWDDARSAYDAPSRRKHKRKKYIFLTDQKNPGNKLKIPYKEYPAPMVFYYMDTAGFLLGLSETVDRINTWTFVKRQLLWPVGSSRPREPPPQALTDPYVNLSVHTAPLIHSLMRIRIPNVQTT